MLNYLSSIPNFRQSARVSILATNRSFSSTFPLFREDEASFTIGGVSLTRSDVLAMKPVDRTIGHWSILVDWTLQASKPFVVVDPFDPNGLLYLSSNEYLLQARVCANNNITLLVVARPGSKEPDSTPSSSKFPPSWMEEFRMATWFSSRNNRLAWAQIAKLRAFARRSLKIENGMVTVTSTTVGKAVLLWGRQLLHYAAVRSPEYRYGMFSPFAEQVQSLIRHNGLNYTVKYIKISLFALYSYLSGNNLKGTSELGLRVKLTCGLPTWIPVDIRQNIRSGQMVHIRIWCSMLNIYRALKAKSPDPESAYVTIRKPCPNLDETPYFSEWKYFCKEVFPGILRQKARENGKWLPTFVYRSNTDLLIPSAAVNLRGSISNLSMILDAQAWGRLKENLPLMWFELNKDYAAAAFMQTALYQRHWPEDRDLCSELERWEPNPTPDSKENLRRTEELLLRLRHEGSFSSMFADAWRPAREVKSLFQPITGRIFNFDAPGGKLRTVAICDYWTQIGMKSVHDYLFSVLRCLEGCDATFDQTGTVQKYWELGLKPHWSFDLSAATDSIPIPLYTELLSHLLIQDGESATDGRNRAELWARVMTDRDFAIPSPRKGEVGYQKGGPRQYRSIRYETGQPMGAYSSWASMALLHHALVQFSFYLDSVKRNKRSWFASYLVLGDDVDIACDSIVAQNYQLVCGNFGIKIGLAKSLRSDKNFFEFANMRYCPEGNISPLSLNEEASAFTWSRRREFANRILSRFGRSTNNDSALMRAVLNAQQWKAISPEFQESNPTMLRLFRFILRSFSVLTQKECRIESLLKWLGGINSSLRQEFDSSKQANTLEIALVNRVRSMLEAELDRREAAAGSLVQMTLAHWRGLTRTLTLTHGDELYVEEGALPREGLVRLPDRVGFAPTYRYDVSGTTDSTPLPLMDAFCHYLGHFGQTEASSVASSVIWGSVICPAEQAVQSPEFVPRDANRMAVLLYHCINAHNLRLSTKLNKIRVRLEKEVGPSTIRGLHHEEYHAERKTQLGSIIQLWAELSRTPAAISLKDVSTLKVALRGTVKADLSKEYADKLLVAILPVLAEHLGFITMDFPFDAIRGARAGPLGRLLRSLKREWSIRAKAVENAVAGQTVLSPVIVQQGPTEQVLDPNVSYTIPSANPPLGDSIPVQPFENFTPVRMDEPTIWDLLEDEPEPEVSTAEPQAKSEPSPAAIEDSPRPGEPSEAIMAMMGYTKEEWRAKWDAA